MAKEIRNMGVEEEVSVWNKSEQMEKWIAPMPMSCSHREGRNLNSGNWSRFKVIWWDPSAMTTSLTWSSAKLLDFDTERVLFWLCCKIAIWSRKSQHSLILASFGNRNKESGFMISRTLLDQKLGDYMDLCPYLNLGRITSPLWFVEGNHKPQTHC